MVGPIQKSSLSAKFRKANYKRQNMASELLEGDIWIDVLLQQLAPAIEITTEHSPETSLGSSEGKFNIEADLARLFFSMDGKA